MPLKVLIGDSPDEEVTLELLHIVLSVNCGVIVLLSQVPSVMCSYRRSVLDSETLIPRVIRTRLELTSCVFLMPAIVPFHRSSIWAVGYQVLYLSTLAPILSYFIFPLFPSFCMFFVSPSCPRVRLLPSYFPFFVPFFPLYFVPWVLFFKFPETRTVRVERRKIYLEP